MTISPLARDLTAMVAVFAVGRVAAAAWISPHAGPDSPTYLDLDFLGGAYRLWTVPLLYNVLPDADARIAGQVLIGVVAWATLAVALARCCRHRAVARAAAAAVLLLGLTTPVTQWDIALLSESVTLSLTVLGTTLALHLARGRGGRGVVAALGATIVLWTFARHVNAMVLLLALPALAGILLWRLRRGPALVAVAALVLVAAWAGYSVARDERVWPGNAFGLLTQRLLLDREATRHFVERGLVLTPELRETVGGPLRPSMPAFVDPRFQRWLKDEWRPAYASYLAGRPVETIITPLREAPRLLTEPPESATPRRVLPRRLEGLFWPRSPALIAVLGATPLLAYLLSLRRGPPRRVEVVPAALFALAAIWLELTWTLTGGELPRLALPAAVALRLALILLGAFTLDRLAGDRQGPLGRARQDSNLRRSVP